MKNKIPIKMIDWYKTKVSPGLGVRCRYWPSCSCYAKGCYEKYNFFKATGLSIWRLLRCNPFSKGGYDPIPLTKTEKMIEATNFNSALERINLEEKKKNTD